MDEIDLIPGGFRQRRGLHRRVRYFLGACVAVLCLVAAARLTLAYLSWRETARVVQLEQQNQTQQQNKVKTEALRQKKQVTEQQLAALDQLRGRDRVAIFMRAIDQAYRDGVWLDSVHFMRRAGTGKLTYLPGATQANIVVVPAGAEANAQFDVSQGAELVGHALNHTVLADFMQRLSAQRGVTDLQLVSTGTSQSSTTQVVDFSLNLQIDALRRGKTP